MGLLELNPVTISIIAGAAGFVLLVVLAMVLRDLRRAKNPDVQERIGDEKTLRAIKKQIQEEGVEATWTGGSALDRRFYLMVRESGLGITTSAAFLLILLAGVTVGGAVYVWWESILPAVALALLAMVLVVLYLIAKQAAYRRELYKMLPPAIELLARAVRAGESVDQAIKLVGESTPDPLGREFGRAASQMEMGLSLAAAMQAMARRLGIMELRILAAALTVQRRSGGNLAVTLERIAAVIRDRQSYRSQFRANTAGARYGAVLVILCLPLYLGFILFVQPEFGEAFFASMTGWFVLLGAIALMLMGVAWIFSLLRTDY
ncbi:MAG: type II secretion system F family protein [Pirellulales bacterium]|nr:type II secretion system F family protein [Pirellulales bacterium]